MNQSEPIGRSVRCPADGGERRERRLGARRLLRPVGDAVEGRARQAYLERAVQDPCREARVEVAAQLAGLLPTHHDPLERRERVLDLVHLTTELRAPRDLADEHTYEIGVRLPGTGDDAGDGGELLP